MESTLPATVPIKELLALSAAEKIAIIGALWDSIEASTAPVPAWQLEELERREAAERAAPEPTVSWEEAQQQARTAHAQPRSA